MPVAIKGSGGGSVTLDAGAAAADTTLTLPNTSGTILQSGTAVTAAQGGTGAVTLTANAVLIGNGTSAVTAVAPSTDGNVLTSNGTAWTSAAPASSGGTVTSVATGTGLTGGTITTSGTISLVTTAGAVGTYGFLFDVTGTFPSFGSTAAGGNLRPFSLDASSTCFGTLAKFDYDSGSPQSGTWKFLGGGGSRAGLWLRIA